MQSLVSRRGRDAFLCILFLAVFEGSVRKWLNPALGEVLILLRDLVAIAYIYLAWRSGALRQFPNLLLALTLWSCLVIFWAALQIFLGVGEIRLALFGFRFWLLYLWLALAFASGIGVEHWRQITGVVFYLSILMVPLAIFQFISPRSHWINSLPDTEVERIFVVAGDVVRVTGTFTFTIGFTCFVSLAAPILLSSEGITSNAKFSARRLLSLLGVLCCIILIVVSGSRALVVLGFGLVLTWLILNILLALRGRGDLLMSTLLIVIGALFSMELWIPYIEPLRERFFYASLQEDSGLRLSTILFGESYLLEEADLLGLGLGRGINSANERGLFAVAESEPGRVILEMGLVGYIWLLIKVSVVLTISWLALMRFYFQGSTLPLLMALVVGVVFLTWPIGGQLSAHVFGFLMLPLSISTLRVK